MADKQQELITTIIDSANELAALYQDAVLPISPPAPDEPPLSSDSILIGNVMFPIIQSPVHNLFVVDPRPLLDPRLYEWQKYDHKDSFDCDQNATLRKTGILRWELETTHHGKYQNAVHYGRWWGVVQQFAARSRFIASAYFLENKWVMYFQSSPRDHSYVRTPLHADEQEGTIVNTCGPFRGLQLSELRLPPMSATHGRYVLKERPEPNHKCEAHPKLYAGKNIPCLSFLAAWEGGNEVSEAILQMT